MVSVYTPNIQLEEPARGDQVGTWDTPVNANMTLVDLVVGGTATIPLAGAPVVLAAAQFQAKTIIFNSTLTASVTITFPSSFMKSYEILNQCTGSSNFTITLKTTAAAGQVIGARPGEFFDVVNDGTNLRYKNMGHIGSYWDYAGSSVPNWVSACTVAPYLNCDGTAFSSATFPALTTILGSTTLPDSRGRARSALNQGTARVTTAGSGLDGNTAYSGGGADTISLLSSQIPQITSNNTTQNIVVGSAAVHIPFANASWAQTNISATGASATVAFTAGSVGDVTTISGTNSITVTSTNTNGAAHSNVQPTFIHGLTLIRAA